MTVQQANWLAELLDTRALQGFNVDGETTWAVEAASALDVFQCLWDAHANGMCPPSGPVLRGIDGSPRGGGKVMIY